SRAFRVRLSLLVPIFRRRLHRRLVFLDRRGPGRDQRRGSCVSRTWFRAFRRELTLRLLHLFVVIGLDDVTHYRPGRFAAMLSAFLNQHSDNNLRVAPRRVANEPGIVFKSLLFPYPLARGISNHLGSSRFSTELYPGQFERRSSPALVHDAVHR